jgi:hypothetical protein
MRRRDLLGLAGPLLLMPAAGARAQPPARKPRTTVAIDGEAFRINGRPTYRGRTFRGMKIEGLLMNARLVQGIFDDRNPETRDRWKYPDTGVWDAERNTREFIDAMPAWRAHGLLAFTVNLQGGSPQGYSKDQPWHNSAFESDGSIRPDYLLRLERILTRADELGMVAIVGYFYFGQDQRLASEGAVLRATRLATEWLLGRDYRHVLVEVANECDNARYDHAILKPARIPVLIELVKALARKGRRLLTGTSFNGGSIPTPEVVHASDFVLLHGNGVSDPEGIEEMVRRTRALPGWKPKPIVFNEDDHFDFEKPTNNMQKAVASYASWGYFDPGKSDYENGYQCPPVNWSINTDRKKAFFALIKDMTNAE